ncbi:MAG: NUDIX domain-containing protein [Planctomycetota bacterium]
MTRPDALSYKIACLCDLRDARGRVLLLERAKNPNKGLFSPIGGKLDTALGESPTRCAQREIHEETGLVIPVERLHLGGIISEQAFGGDTNWLMFWFRVLGPVELEPVEMNEGRLDWHEPESITDLPLPATDREVIWPVVNRHDGGFFALHIDCRQEPMAWTLEESRPGPNPGG